MRKKEIAVALAGRPGWEGSPYAPGVRDRYGVNHPFNAKEREFSWLLHGPLPGGAQAEVFRYITRTGSSRFPTTTFRTVATVVFPHPLPSVSARPVRNADEAWAPVSIGSGYAQTFNEGAFGPLWHGLRGYALDPAVGRAVLCPETLDRTRSLGLDWRMDGHVAMGVVREQRSPQRMLMLVDTLLEFASLIPPEGWESAAAQPDPWPGPSVERPA
ncbi:hypothetical protein ABIA33_006686 [Streptacidiphilus sp. MAP12-16]|uniref:hypothetical protein n=1 Tax=Streptacidiphilus sp. MAP12-16 TaxID=3156300 RepID=UPI0035135791